MNNHNEKIIVGFIGGLLFYSCLFVYGCQEEPIEPTEPQCQCYEVHEVLEPVNVNGMPSLQWVIDYETSPIEGDCSSETEYTNVNNTERWKRVCQ